MSSLNKIILIGNMVSEAEIRETTSGHVLSRFKLEVERPNKQEHLEKQTDIIQTVSWRELAESTKPYKKGSRLLVEGKIITRTYDDENNKRHYITEVEARDIKLLSADTSENTPSSSEQNNEDSIPSLEETPLPNASDFDFNEAPSLDLPKATDEDQASPVNLGSDIEENIPF